jgi:hypothetical protein
MKWWGHPADRGFWRELWGILTFEVPTISQRRRWYNFERSMWPNKLPWEP